MRRSIKQSNSATKRRLRRAASTARYSGCLPRNANRPCGRDLRWMLTVALRLPMHVLTPDLLTLARARQNLGTIGGTYAALTIGGAGAGPLTSDGARLPKRQLFSASFASLVIGIESLGERNSGATARFRNFIERYAPGAG